jgi:hypothetical protein
MKLALAKIKRLFIGVFCNISHIKIIPASGRIINRTPIVIPRINPASTYLLGFFISLSRIEYTPIIPSMLKAYVFIVEYQGKIKFEHRINIIKMSEIILPCFFLTKQYIRKKARLLNSPENILAELKKLKGINLVIMYK